MLIGYGELRAVGCAATLAARRRSLSVGRLLKRRDESLNAAGFATAKRRVVKIEAACAEVTQHEAVRARARRLLEVHPLRTADGLHLAAALVAYEDHTAGVEFVTFDGRLGEAASKEGFQVLGEPDHV